MKIKNLFFLTALAFLIAGCATYTISSDYEKETNFSSFHTYKIMEHDHNFPVGANPINKQRIDRAINKEMTARGYTTADNPDLLVSWFVKVKDVKQVDIYHNHYRQYNNYHHVEVHEYQEGSLVIDLVDRAKNQVVWHGKTTDTVYEGMTNVEEKINEAVSAMFKRYSKDAKVSKGVAFN